MNIKSSSKEEVTHEISLSSVFECLLCVRQFEVLAFRKRHKILYLIQLPFQLWGKNNIGEKCRILVMSY